MLEGLRAIPEGDGNLLDNTATVFVHEHAEADPHKCNGLAMLVAGGGIKGNMHTKTHNGIGDVYLHDRGRGAQDAARQGVPDGRREDDRFDLDTSW